MVLRAMECREWFAITRGIERERIHPDAKPEVVFETPISAVIDGHNGMGQLISVFAMKRQLKKRKNRCGHCQCP